MGTASGDELEHPSIIPIYGGVFLERSVWSDEMLSQNVPGNTLTIEESLVSTLTILTNSNEQP